MPSSVAMKLQGLMKTQDPKPVSLHQPLYVFSFGPLLARGDKHRAVIESVDSETRHAYQRAQDCKEN